MEPQKRRRWRRLALEIGAVVLVFLGVRAWQHRGVAEGPAPELRGPSLTGEALELPRSPGEPVLVHFWATWCGVCRAEEGTVDALSEDYRVITVATQSGGASDVARYLAERELDFPVIVDPSGVLARRWGVHAFPTSFVVGPDGQVRSTEVGYTTSLGFRVRLWLARLM